ncbi:MAG: glycosyltransferase family 8 protein [Lawsonibacter sp.]|nr:glycosyltransferase family 8 protein [Lawsonibacter sp.]
MDILVTVDRNYLRPLSVMLKSLAVHHRHVPVRVFILHRSLLPEDLRALEQAVGEPELELVSLPAGDSLLSDAPTTDRYPLEMYDRIFAARYLPPELDRVLYLDPDLVVNGPLDDLWSLDLGDSWFAAASHVAKGLERLNAVRLQSEVPGPYINSGVLLMNLPLLRREQQLQPVLDYVETHRRTLFLPDQDVISALYGDKILRLNPYRYNMTERLFAAAKLSPRGELDLSWVEENSRIIHYCGRNKPWKESYLGQLDRFYQFYAQMTKPI